MCFRHELEEPKVAKVLFLPLISWLLWPKQLKVIERQIWTPHRLSPSTDKPFDNQLYHLK